MKANLYLFAMSYKKNIENLIYKEIKENKAVTHKSLRLYVENRISYKRFLEIQKEALL